MAVAMPVGTVVAMVGVWVVKEVARVELVVAVVQVVMAEEETVALVAPMVAGMQVRVAKDAEAAETVALGARAAAPQAVAVTVLQAHPR